MKYKITNIDPTITIKKYKLDKKGFKVKYLKGSKLIPYSKANFETLRKTMEEQALSFINNSTFEEKLEKYRKYNRFFSLTQLTCLGSYLSAMIFKQYSVIIPMVLFGIIQIPRSFIHKKVNNYRLYKNKYELYFKHKEKLEKYLFYHGINLEINDLDRIKYEDFMILINDCHVFMDSSINNNEISLGEPSKLLQKIRTFK